LFEVKWKQVDSGKKVWIYQGQKSTRHHTQVINHKLLMLIVMANECGTNEVEN